MNNYFPSSLPGKKAWAQNFITVIPDEAKKLNESADDAAAIQVSLQDMNDKIDAAGQATANAKKLLAARDEVIRTNSEIIRKYAKRLKANPHYTEETGKNLQIIYKSTQVEDLTTFKPVIKVRISGGHPEIWFVKKNADAIAIHGRVNNAAEWTLVGIAMKSKYIDMRPPLVAGTPQFNEYFGMAVYNNVETGLPSEIVSVNFKG